MDAPTRGGVLDNFVVVERKLRANTFHQLIDTVAPNVQTATTLWTFRAESAHHYCATLSYG